MNRHLLIIDPQRDFCKPGGALYVQGADEDMARLAAMPLDAFDQIHVTLDSHGWVHIAHPIFWTDEQGNSPAPFTVVEEGAPWQARDPELREYARDYVRQLASKGRYALTIWPPHCILGTPGHAVHDELATALRAWSEARLIPIDFILKGSNPKTEHYSAIQADVPDPADPSTAPNARRIASLEEADELYVAGEALDYCLLNTLRDLVAQAPDLPPKIVLLRDAASSIGACTVDDHEFFQGLRAQGARVATTAETTAC